MGLAVALLAQRSLAFELYAATLNGISVDELASQYGLSKYWIQEQLQATAYALRHQVCLDLNTAAFKECNEPRHAA
jgi:Mor family transcriptional regulator